MVQANTRVTALSRYREFYGLCNDSVNIFESYLNNRFQFVSVRGVNSDLKAVSTGVPQGSFLGPLLFIVAINYLPRNIDIDCVLYADDTTIFASDGDL
jgi:hypothetical protein